MISILILILLSMSLADNIPRCQSGTTHLAHTPIGDRSIPLGCANSVEMTFCRIHSSKRRECEINKAGHRERCDDQRLSYGGKDSKKDCYFIINPPIDSSEIWTVDTWIIGRHTSIILQIKPNDQSSTTLTTTLNTAHQMTENEVKKVAGSIDQSSGQQTANTSIPKALDMIASRVTSSTLQPTRKQNLLQTTSSTQNPLDTSINGGGPGGRQGFSQITAIPGNTTTFSHQTGLNPEPKPPAAPSEEDENCNIYIIVGATFAILIFFAILVLIICFKKKIKINQIKNYLLGEKAPRNNSIVTNEGNYLKVASSIPIPISSFSKEVAKGKIPPKSEFSDLNQIDKTLLVTNKTQNDGRSYSSLKNGNLNRYANVLPYDHNRVKITPSDDFPDYINASWIKNRMVTSTMPKFIATQGPLPHTCPQFLQMVLEQQVQVIVMLTPLEESINNDGFQYEKCAQYWPPSDNGLVRFGNVEIETTKKVILRELQNTEKRLLKIRDTRKALPASKVHHFQFTEWPDYGAATSSMVIIDLIKTIRPFVKKGSTVVVHCSAGVGRSGTFIALYKLIDKIENKVIDDSIDIFNEVVQLRKDRCLMVQTANQYKFLYSTMAEYLEQRNESVIYETTKIYM